MKKNRLRGDWLRGRRWCGAKTVKYDDFPVPAALYKRIFLEHPHYSDQQIRQVARAVEAHIKANRTG